MCSICLIISVIGVSNVPLIYFSCIKDIPSGPQLFLAGRLSIILDITHSSTSWNVKKSLFCAFKYEA